MDDRPSGGREAPVDRTRRTGRLVRRSSLSCAAAARRRTLAFGSSGPGKPGSLPCVEHVPHHRVRPRELWAFDLEFTATTALPYDPLDRATAGLRAELSKKVAAVQAGNRTGRRSPVNGPRET